MQKMRRMNVKRALCLFMVVALLFTIFPSTAATADGEYIEVETAPVEVEQTQPEVYPEPEDSVDYQPEVEVEYLPEADEEDAPAEVAVLSGFVPAGVPADLVAGAEQVTNESQLRTALGRSTTRAIVLMNDIEITGAVMPASGTAHVFSDSEAGFSVIRTAGTARHINITGTLHLYNVRLTRPAGPERPDGSISTEDSPGGFITPGGPAGDGGGISMNVVAARLHMHAGSEISHNRAAGRGGGLLIHRGQAVLNEGAVISHNHTRHSGTGGGGGIFINNGEGSPGSTAGQLTVNGATIAYNHSAASGGGISLAQNQVGNNATLYVNDIILRGNTAANFGGGLHANTRSDVEMQGVIILEHNVANNGGGMRFFSGRATNIDVAPGSIVRHNVARENGAGISIPNQNNVGLRIDGTLFYGNVAIGEGGAIRHEGNAMGATRGIEITNSQFINNRALNGGAISMVASEHNLPVMGHAASLRITNTTFSGNTATNGLLIDENLAARNATHITSVGSAAWYGPRTDINANVQAIELRNHIWNNYDVISRNQMAARYVNFDFIGTAAENATMAGQMTQTVRSTNHTSVDIGLATTATVPVNPAQVLLDGEAVLRDSLTAFQVTYFPWNADILYWLNHQSTRAWVGDPVTGSLVETSVTTTIANSANATQQTNVPVNEHTHLQARVDYRYHSVRFEASPSTATTGGTLNGQAFVENNLRESRSAADHAGYTGVTPRGNPIGTLPTVQASPGWEFLRWEHNGQEITAEAIEAMYVGSALTFVAVFGELFPLAVGNVPALDPLPEGQTTNADHLSGVTVALAHGTLAPAHSYQFFGWIRGDVLPSVGDNINDWLAANPMVTMQSAGHSFEMPAHATRYTAIWGNHGIVGGPGNQVVFHFYGTSIESVTIPVIIGEPIDLTDLHAAMEAVEDVYDMSTGYAFWGWFEDQVLTASGRVRYENSTNMNAGLRRPVVGTHGFDISQAITEELFATMAQDATIYFYAIWALWGDVNDDDEVDLVDANLLAQYVRGAYPRPVINLIAADVVRDGDIDLLDANVLVQYVRGAYPRPVLGRAH